MGKSELGQVIDREGLDSAPGPRGRLRLQIPAGWARDGGELEVAVPSRVACDRCDGGGCDGCERSGAHRTPAEPAGRTLRLQLPADTGCTVTLRLVRPFGADAPIEQLLIEISAGDAASPGVTRVEPPSASGASGPGPGVALPSRRDPRLVAAVASAVAVIAAVLGLLASASR